MDAPLPSDEHERGGGWLPPEPEGPRPDVGGDPPAAPGGSADPRSPAGPSPAPGSGQAPTPQASAPDPAPSAYGPAGGGQPVGFSAPYEEGPGNPQAVAALVLGIVAVTMAVLGFFLITLPIAVICGVIAIVLGRAGKRKVDRGETRRQRGFAQAGFITGIVGTVLGLLGIVGVVLLFLLSEEFQRGFERGFEQGYGGVLLAGLMRLRA